MGLQTSLWYKNTPVRPAKVKSEHSVEQVQQEGGQWRNYTWTIVGNAQVALCSAQVALLSDW